MSAAVSKKEPTPMSIGEWMPIDALTPWDRNPRLNDAAAPRVAESIKTFGFVSPIVIWGSQRRMVAGHTRLKAMKLLLGEDAAFVPAGAPAAGLVPVRFHEFKSEEEADLYALADNRLGEIAEWDEGQLKEILEPYTAEARAAAGFEEWKPSGQVDPIEDPPPPEKSTPTFICPKCGHTWTRLTAND